ncbi:unnamed protein product [Tilletia caries]|nr:unnamed protein product [Tilletia caries]
MSPDSLRLPPPSGCDGLQLSDQLTRLARLRRYDDALDIFVRNVLTQLRSLPITGSRASTDQLSSTADGLDPTRIQSTIPAGFEYSLVVTFILLVAIDRISHCHFPTSENDEAIIDADKRRQERPLAPHAMRDVLARFDEEDVAAGLEELLADQASHEHTNVKRHQQLMLIDLKIELDHFYDAYKQLNGRGFFGQVRSTPPDILDYASVPDLRHRLESFLSFKRQRAMGGAGKGKVTRGTLMTWTWSTLALVRKHVVAGASAGEASVRLKTVLRHTGDGTQGVYRGLLNHAAYLVEYYRLPIRAAETTYWTRLEVEMVLGHPLDSIFAARLSAEGEVILQRVILLQLIFCTGLRIGSLISSEIPSGDFNPDPPLRQEISSLNSQAKAGYQLSHAVLAEPAIESFHQKENVILSPIWSLVALLVRRGSLKKAGAAKPLVSIDDFFASKAARFIGVGEAPVFRMSTSTSDAMTNAPLYVTAADNALARHARDLGLKDSGWHKIRRDFAAHISAAG